MKKINFFIFTIIVAGAWFFFPYKTFAASLNIEPQVSGLTRTKIHILGASFCSHNAGFPVILLWDGAAIGTGNAPSFDFPYTVPGDAKAGTHQIIATANCPGVPPAIPPTVDQAITVFEVTNSDSSDQVADNNPDTSVSSDAQDQSDTTSDQGGGTPTTVAPGNKAENNSSSQTKTPWYLNWIYLASGGVGIILLILGIIWVVKSTRKSKGISKPVPAALPKPKPQPQKVVKETPIPPKTPPPTPPKSKIDQEPAKPRVEFEE